MWNKITPNLNKQTNDDRHLFYAHDNVFNWDMLNKFICENGFVAVAKLRPVAELKWFLENGRDVKPKSNLLKIRAKLDKLRRPYADHDYYFKLPSGECIYVSHPYVPKDEAEKVVTAWADTLGIKGKVYDSSYSWYYPNCEHLCVIVLSLQDRDVKMPKYGE